MDENEDGFFNELDLINSLESIFRELDDFGQSVFLDCREDLVVGDSDLHLNFVGVGGLGGGFFVVGQRQRFGYFWLLVEFAFLDVLQNVHVNLVFNDFYLYYKF